MESSAKDEIRLESLRPTTSSLTWRYQTTSSRVIPRPQNIAAGHLCFGGEPHPQYLPPGCAAHIHPEGQVYFAWDGYPNVVTENWLYSKEAQNQLEAWRSLIATVLKERDIQLSDTVELYLELEESTGSCLYYFVDHATRSAFWLEEHSTDDLYMRPIVSDSHLRLALEGQYWSHVEFFPSHRFDKLSLSCNELIGIFIQGRADRMTSDNSTFPHSASQSAEFIEILRSTQNCPMSSYSTWTVARLWSLILNHRFNTHYGQQRARLSADQSILDGPFHEECHAFKMANCLLFGIPRVYTRRLDALFLDRLLYIEPWRKFMSSAQNEWKSTIVVGLALLIVNAIFLLSPVFSSVVATICILFCNASIMAAAILMWQHQESTSQDAATAYEYLASVERETTGFQHIATVYALPKATLFWSLGVSSLQGLIGVAKSTNVFVSVGIALCIVILALLTRTVTLHVPKPPCNFTPSLRSLLCCFRRSRRSEDYSEIPCEV